MTASTNSFNQIIRLANQYKLPCVDIETLFQGQSKDVEEMLKVGRNARGISQTLAQKQAEVLCGALENLRGVMSTRAKASAMQADMARSAAKQAIDRFAEMTLVSLRSHSDAFDFTKERTQRNIEELKALLFSPKVE